MRQTKQLRFTCPHCGNEQEFSVWESVNVSQTPALKEQVLKGELGRFTCSGCARTLWVGHAIHYHDPGRKLMIWLPHGQAQKPPLAEGSALMNLMAKTGYAFRLVESYNELIEKIRVFDDHQDDRVLEALKLSIPEEQKAPSGQRLFYDGIVEKGGSNKAVRLAVVKKEGQTAQEVSWEEWGRQATALSRAPVSEGESRKWLRVDRDYASELLKRAEHHQVGA
jgi:RNase P subunit RPR2